MRNITSPMAVVLGLVLGTVAAVRPNADLNAAHATIARLETRVAALERAATSQGQTVRAPFRVLDIDGDQILSVSAAEGTATLMLGGGQSASVELVAAARAGSVTVSDIDTAGTSIGRLSATRGAAQLRVIGRSHSATLTATDKEQGAVLSLFAGNTPSARIRAGLEGHGALVLTDKSGYPMVRAGVLKGDVVGVVWTGPRMRPGSMGPSVIQGAK